MTDLLRKEIADKLKEQYGSIKSVSEQEKNGMLNFTYENGVQAWINPSGMRLEVWPGKISILIDLRSGKARVKDDATGKFTQDFVVPESGLMNGHPAPRPVSIATADLKNAPVAVAPAVAGKRKREESSSSSSSSSGSSSDSDSGSSSSGSSSDEDKIKKPAKRVKTAPKSPVKKASPKKAAKPAAKPAKEKKPAAKKAPVVKRSPVKKKSPVKRAPPSTPKKEIKRDYNNDAEATLAMIVLKLGETLDLGDAAAQEEARIARAEEEAKNQKAPKKPARGRFPVNYDALEKKIVTLKSKLKTEQARLAIKDRTADVSLGTSKTNYIDPRIIHSWCKREEVDLRKVYSATLVQKFPWAQVAGEDWRF